MKLIAFCEALADFRLVSGLFDRMLRELGPAWVVEGLDVPAAIRTWHSDAGLEHVDVHHLNAYADRLRDRGLRVRRVRGHFDGKPGDAGGAMARKAFLIVEALNRRAPDDPIDAVVLLWDADHQREDRSAGVGAARDEARRWATFHILCGFPDPAREAWLLAGFDPADDRERGLVDDLARELGFSPITDAARLRDKDHGALRDIKRVLDILTSNDPDREARCWTEPTLETLRTRGTLTGLVNFLDELEAAIPALCGAPRR